MLLKTKQRALQAKAYRLQSKRMGAIVVLFAILLPLLVLILGFTVDYAYMQRSRNEIRVLSDLAVRAATDTLARTGGDENAAAAAARFVAANNTVAGENISLEDDQIIFGRSYRQPDGSYTYVAGDRPANSVQVIARRDRTTSEGPISTFFGAAYNRPTFDVEQVAEASFRDVEIVLVLDRSGSMKFPLVASNLTAAEKQQRFINLPGADSRWKALDSAVEVFLSELESTPVREKVGLVTFAENASLNINGQPTTVDRVTLDAQLSQNLNQVRSNIDRLNTTVWFGGTNITAGLEEARLHYADSGSANVEKIIICLTDGVHNATGIHDPFVEAINCVDDGIKVYTITFSEGANKADMILTAENGGGTHSHAPDEATLKTIFKRLAGSIAFISK
jgi:Flp pilus assembly protein TadG